MSHNERDGYRENSLDRRRVRSVEPERNSRSPNSPPESPVDARIEKTTTELVRSYDLIVIEDLKVKNMSRSSKGTRENPGKNVAQKRGLNRSIRSQAWALLRKRLKDKAANATSPVVVIPINPKFTSQTCPQCEHVAEDNRKSQAVFSCINCGHTTNADINAAKNILAAGLAVTGRRGTLQQKPTEAEHSGPVKRQPPEGRVA